MCREREKDPHFATPGTFEYEFGLRWKQLEELEKNRIENVKKEMEEARIKLEDEMQNALYDYQADQIRQGHCLLLLCCETQYDTACVETPAFCRRALSMGIVRVSCFTVSFLLDAAFQCSRQTSNGVFIVMYVL